MRMAVCTNDITRVTSVCGEETAHIFTKLVVLKNRNSPESERFPSAGRAHVALLEDKGSVSNTHISGISQPLVNASPGVLKHSSSSHRNCVYMCVYGTYACKRAKTNT